MNAIQIPVAVPQGMSRKSIDKITEQLTMYAQFLFSHVRERDIPSKEMTLQEAQQYLDTLTAKDVNVPADVNGMKDIINSIVTRNPKDYKQSTIRIIQPSDL